MALEKLVMGGYIKASFTWDPPNIPAGGGVNTGLNFSVPGAALGDGIFWGPNWDFLSACYWYVNVKIWVAAADVVVIGIGNTSTATAIDLNPITFNIWVLKK